MTMDTAPIVLFVYNRAWHTQQTVEALRRNELAEQSDLHVFSDGPRSAADRQGVGEVREFIRTVGGFRSVAIVERAENLGLARSVVTGVSDVIGARGRAIVMEDDLLSAPNFLVYMNRALDLYRDHPAIFSVTGVNFPIEFPADYAHQAYLSYRASSWGGGTWEDRC